MEEKLSGIVLGGVNFGENDKILKILTLEKGVISARIKGVKKAGAKLKFAAEPFSFVEFIFSVRGDMRTVIGASFIDSFYPLRENLEKYFCAGAVIEFAKKFYKENVNSTEEFMLTVNALKDIAYGDDWLKALTCYFINALCDSGFMLSLGKCACCGHEILGKTFFDYRRGGFFCERCFDGVGREINNDTFLALSNVQNGKETQREWLIKALKLIKYYIENRTEEKILSLDELIKILF